jgi:exopolysaccharide biosynthesis protein
MLKRIITAFVLLLGISTFSVSLNEIKAANKNTPVYWEGMELVKGQTGMVSIIKPINLWKKDQNNKLHFSRVLKPGEKYRVYQYDVDHGGQYGLGGGYFVTNLKGYVQYKTPSKYKLKIVNPNWYQTKISIGTVVDEDEEVIAPGVVKSELDVDSSTAGKQQIYKIDIDQKSSKVTFETSLSKDQMIGFETVSSMANRYESEENYVIAGINGDYFDKNGAPTDLTVHNGEVVTTNTTTKSERTIFGLDSNGQAMIGNPDIYVGITVNGQKPYSINSINKRRDAGHLVLYTPYFASNTMTNELGTEVVLTNIQGKLNGNGTVNATVKEIIKGVGSAKLQEGEWVLSGHAAGSEYLQALKQGDTVQLTLNYDQANWSHVHQAIGGRYQLVKNGVTQSFNISGAHPRTAIGIKADGSVFAIVVDGRQKSSVGLTLSDLAKVMKDFGAVEAMTFDGGGSSAMVIKEGEKPATTVNQPSDGKERSVSNSLLILGKYSTEPVSVLEVSKTKISLYAGQNYKDLGIVVKGRDKNGIPVNVKDLSWTSNVGVFGEDGSFTAREKAGNGTVTVASGSAKTNIEVTIIGNPTGPLTVEDFEGDLSKWSASGARYNSVYVGAEKNYVKSGKQSLKVSYDFIGTVGTSGIYANKDKAIAIPGKPIKIGMWVYGDGKGHWLRAQLTDGSGKEVQLDFTKNLDWVGWKYIETTIPTGLQAPYQLDTPVRYMEVEDQNKNKGQIFVDLIQAIY